MAQPKYSDWNFSKKLVDPGQVYTGTGNDKKLNFVTSESVLIGAGPSELSANLNTIVPIGVIQNFNVSQNKNITQLFEIGSKEAILIPGRTYTQSSISRMLLDGPSLMKLLYGKWADSGVSGTAVTPQTAPSQVEEGDETLGVTAGDGDFYINLASNLFNKPFGLALLMHDMNNEVYAGAYFEKVLIAAHNIGFSAGQTIVAENCTLRIGNVKPIKFKGMN